jgi:hypothetical protein
MAAAADLPVLMACSRGPTTATGAATAGPISARAITAWGVLQPVSVNSAATAANIVRVTAGATTSQEAVVTAAVDLDQPRKKSWNASAARAKLS